ncbi:enoyl-CoA hydratase/isomerase family protein [uncultured Castellaniella sp.]|uniref:enoyl-CoA hydratase/isomerase family protein n=1 Tax=uncultured Castellaniella sp. TaxID=647907 RepID=UPI00263202B1|nr:enoyl-CoA hydratase/isomerase family protein [uncultured Castellaniella sp.]
MQDQAPALAFEGDVATLTLRRVSQHNRIAPDDCAVISGHLRRAADRNGIRALVLTGAGEKTFSSGYTLGAIRDQLDSRFEDMLDELEAFPLPTICALNGSVYGGATDLALCCDFRIGVAGSRFLMPASRIGLHYYPGGIRRYVTVLGLAAAKKLFLTGQAIHDREMLRIGFLHELVDPGDLMAAVERYVEGIRACEPAVLRSMKADLMQVAAGRWDEAGLRAHYEASLRSDALASRLDALAGKS